VLINDEEGGFPLIKSTCPDGDVLGGENKMTLVTCKVGSGVSR